MLEAFRPLGVVHTFISLERQSFETHWCHMNYGLQLPMLIFGVTVCHCVRGWLFEIDTDGFLLSSFHDISVM